MLDESVPPHPHWQRRMEQKGQRLSYVHHPFWRRSPPHPMLNLINSWQAIVITDTTNNRWRERGVFFCAGVPCGVPKNHQVSLLQVNQLLFRNQSVLKKANQILEHTICLLPVYIDLVDKIPHLIELIQAVFPEEFYFKTNNQLDHREQVPSFYYFSLICTSPNRITILKSF